MAAHDEDEDFEPKKKKASDEEDESPKKKKASDDEDFEEEKPSKKTSSSKKKSDDDDDDDGVDFGDEKLMKRNVVADKITVEPGKWVRFAFLPGIKLRSTHQHYVQGKGNFRCLSTEDQEGICCKKLGPVDPTFVGLAIQYTNADSKKGKIPSDEAPEVAIMHVKMSQTLYRMISQLPDEDQSPYSIDIAMTMKPNKKGYEVRRMSSNPKWKTDDAVVKQVKEWTEKFSDGKVLKSKLAKKITGAEWKAMLAGITAEDEDTDAEGGMGDMDDI